jgi:hypothetical protein
MISISTKGFTFLVGPDLRWSVVGFHGVQVSSGVFFWPYGCSLRLPSLPGGEVVDTHASPCRDCFMGSFLGGDVFHIGGGGGALACGLELPAEGTGPTYKASSFPIVVHRRWCPSGGGSFPGCSYLMESLSSLIPVLRNITHGKWFLSGGACPLTTS